VFETKIVSVTSSSQAYEAVIARAGRLVRQGELVAFPTETVYGLAANAKLPEALQKLRHVKDRPPDKPFAILVADASEVVRLVGEVPPVARALIEKFWPGPLTIVTAGRRGDETGFRCPDHKVAQDLIRAAGVPIAAPSANLSGHEEPVTAEQVKKDLDGRIPMILDAGPCREGKPSTVVKVQGDSIRMLRTGAISEEEIRRAIMEKR